MRHFEVVSDKYRKNNVDIKLPTRATKNSIGYDFYSPIAVDIEPMHSQMIWTDVKAIFNSDEALIINVRSSMGKQPVMISNTQGWIESDYANNPDNDGNIGFRLFNLGDTIYTVRVGDRIGQGMFIKYLTTDDDNATSTRNGGFGSTGV